VAMEAEADEGGGVCACTCTCAEESDHPATGPPSAPATAIEAMFSGAPRRPEPGRCKAGRAWLDDDDDDDDVDEESAGVGRSCCTGKECGACFICCCCLLLRCAAAAAMCMCFFCHACRVTSSVPWM